MNKEDIIRMAINSHLVMADYDNPSLEAFAALVAAAEREAVAQIVEQGHYAETRAGHAAAIRARGQA